MAELVHAPKMQLSLDGDAREQIDPRKVAVLLAELSAEIGQDNVGVLELVPVHRPETRTKLVPLQDVRHHKRPAREHPKRAVDDREHLSDAEFPAQGALQAGAIHDHARRWSTVSIDHHLFTVKRTSHFVRFDEVEWWTSSPVCRDYVRVWLTSGKKNVEAWVFTDRLYEENIRARILRLIGFSHGRVRRAVRQDELLSSRGCVTARRDGRIRAHRSGSHAIAVADSRGLYGTVRAHVAAKKVAQKYIVAVELPVSLDRTKKTKPLAKAVLLVENKAGYQNLCRLVTRAHVDLLAKKRCSTSAISRAVARGSSRSCSSRRKTRSKRASFVPTTSTPLPEQRREIMGDRAFIATSRWLAPDDRVREHRPKARRREAAPPLIAHQSSALSSPLAQARRRRAAVHPRKDHARPRRRSALAPTPRLIFVRRPAMARLFRDAPDRLARTVEIARACTFSLDELNYSFPCDDVAPGETPDQALSRLVREWGPKRYPGGVPPRSRCQLEKELALIAKLDVAQFFLSVHEIVKIARDKRILCQGRGSAANSAVCYVLGITAVDPGALEPALRALPLRRARTSRPTSTSTSSTSAAKRSSRPSTRTTGAIARRWSREVICYRGKSALREVGKVFGLSLEQVDRLSAAGRPLTIRSMPTPRALAESGLRSATTRASSSCLQVAGELQGFPRHLSIHVGGFVLSAQPLDEVSPVEPAQMQGRTVIPWDKDDIDALGFFKVDVLGLGMLTAIRKALELIHRRAGDDPASFDPIAALAAIPAEDPRRLRRHLQGRHRRRLPDREPRADGDAPAPEAAQILRSGDRGRHRAARAHPGRHGPPVPAAAQRRGGRRRCRTRRSRRFSSERWACRSSRSR